MHAYHLLLEEYGNNSKEREQSFAQLGIQIALFIEDNSIRRNTETHAWNFIIEDIYDLVAYQGK
jgi:hypothetical protein